MKCHDIQYIIMAVTLVFGTGKNYILLFLGNIIIQVQKPLSFIGLPVFCYQLYILPSTRLCLGRLAIN